MANSRKKDIIKLKRELFTPEEIIKKNISVQNFIYTTDKPELKWIEETTLKIADWRQLFSSTYARWALSINGLNLAHDKYSNPDFYTKKQFVVTAVRPSKENQEVPTTIALITWDGQTAAAQHIESVSYISEFGIIDLYSALEEFVFEVYKIFLSHKPDHLLKGSENRNLRKLYRDSTNSSTDNEIWVTEWNKRLNNWHRKKLYDGLAKVFLSYCKEANLKTPSHYKSTNPQTWADTIEYFSLIRNHLVHGASHVDKTLGEFSNNRPWIPTTFKEGDKLELNLNHLQSVELFTAQICDAINFSLLEL